MKLYWTYTLRSLRRGAQRTLLGILCIAVGIMAIVGAELTGAMITDGLASNVRALAGADLTITSFTQPLTA